MDTSGDPGVVTTGCGSMMTTSSKVDDSVCKPQLASTTTCGGSVCTFSVELPCPVDDGGMMEDDAGDADASAAEPPCVAFCNALRPAGFAQGGTFCQAIQQDGSPKVVYQCGGCGVGRPPRGFVPRSASAPNDDAERLAQMAQLEAASVDAFHALHADLARLGAPHGLRRAVLEAADDEVRHARAVRREAERLGACVPAAHVPAPRPRSLEQLAIENAEEGCVNETFGAALAAMQAERATDPRVRRMMSVIAKEELGHAALSWQLAAWLDSRLDARGRERVAEARRGAVAALFEELANEGPGSELLGLPDAATARTTLASMRSALETGDLARAA